MYEHDHGTHRIRRLVALIVVIINDLLFVPVLSFNNQRPSRKQNDNMEHQKLAPPPRQRRHQRRMCRRLNITLDCVH